MSRTEVTGRAPAEPEMWSPATVMEILHLSSKALMQTAGRGGFPDGTVVRTSGGQRRYRSDLVEARFPALVAAWRERRSAS